MRSRPYAVAGARSPVAAAQARAQRALSCRPRRAIEGWEAADAPRGRIPFTPRAKKALERSLREAQAAGDSYIGVQHVALALLSA